MQSILIISRIIVKKNPLCTVGARIWFDLNSEIISMQLCIATLIIIIVERELNYSRDSYWAWDPFMTDFRKMGKKEMPV